MLLLFVYNIFTQYLFLREKRRDGDSNPGYAFDVYTLSRRASSATRASLLRHKRTYYASLYTFSVTKISFFLNITTCYCKKLSGKVVFFNFLHTLVLFYTRKKTFYIGIGDIFHFLRRYIIYICHFFHHLPHISCFVSLSTIWNWGKIGRVCF